MKTKEKILDLAIQQFNEKGYGAVSLQELAQQMGISRGNLTYHFKSKELILEAIANRMWQQFEKERSQSIQFPSFENLHNQVQMYYRFQQVYAFIFLDTHVLNHPTIKRRFREITDRTIQDNQAKLAFAIKMGNFKPEPAPGVYNNLAFITWMLTFYWLSQQIIRGEQTVEDGEKMIWSMLLPHFTDKGLEAFKQFFGEAYFESLGEPFDWSMSKLITF